MIIPWYNDQNPDRFQELTKSLCSNIRNNFISHIHIFSKDNITLFYDSCQLSEEEVSKIKLVEQKQDRFKFSEGFEYSTSQLSDQLVVMANGDILFDESIENVLYASDLDPKSYYALSRYEKDETISFGTQCGDKYIGSHDTFVFVPPVPERIIKNSDIPVGTWGIENRILYEMKKEGISVKNPCLLIRTWHIHDTQIKNSWMPQVNANNKSEVVFPH